MMTQFVQTVEKIYTGNRCNWLLIALIHTAETVILLYHSHSNYYRGLFTKCFCFCMKSVRRTPEASEPCRVIFAGSAIDLPSVDKRRNQTRTCL